MIMEPQQPMTADFDSVQLALAVLMERIVKLPKEDKDDLYALSKVVFTAETTEEVDSARRAMLEILEQQQGRVIRSETLDGPGSDLEKWISFVSGKIKETRKAANLTQEELARRAGLPQSHISRLENGAHSPSFMTLEKIARALGIEVSEFDPCAP